MRPIDADELLARMRERCDSCQHKGNREHCLNLCEWREAMDEVEDSPEIEASVNAGGKPPEAHFADEEDMPHEVSMVTCLNCGKRWIAVRPLGTKLDDLECPQCRQQGAVIETGEELEDDEK